MQDSLFNKWYCKNWTATCKRMKSEHSLTPYTKKTQNGLKIKMLRPDTIKLLEENTGRTLFDIKHSNMFLDPCPKAKEINAKVNKWDLIKT